VNDNGSGSGVIRVTPEDRAVRVGIGGYLVPVNTFATPRMGLELFQRSLLSGDAVLRLGRGESAFAGFMEGA
jgi:hypothetical protein